MPLSPCFSGANWPPDVPQVSTFCGTSQEQHAGYGCEGGRCPADIWDRCELLHMACRDPRSGEDRQEIKVMVSCNTDRKVSFV